MPREKHMSVFNRDMAIESLKNGRGILEIPEGITELSDDFSLVFDWMPEKMCQCFFREIIIPSSVEKIGNILLTEYGPDQAPVKRFKKITVAKDNAYFSDIDGVLFSKDLKRLLCYPCGRTGSSYVVPDTVEVIDEYAFADNTNLRKIVLPESVRRIEWHAFFQCENLSMINLPEGLEYLGEDCFGLSTELNRLVIPMSLKTIPTSLFSEGSIIAIPNNEIELEYDYVPTEYLNMPFIGPAIISNDNAELVDFAESYDYNHFENCFEDRNGIIWADHRKTLVCFPAEWGSEEYELPESVENIYVRAFRGTNLKKFYSNKRISIVGRTEDTPKYYEPMTGKRFHLTAGIIFCDDEKENEKTEDKNIENIERFSIASDDKQVVEIKNNYVFISYSSKNQQVADSVRLLLIEHGVSCWMAPYDIPAGSRYAYVINDALENCSCLLLLLTNASQTSQFVEREIERAITYKKPILPMQLEDLELNSGFKFYIGNSQIIAVPEIRGDSPEFKKILLGLSQLVNIDEAKYRENLESFGNSKREKVSVFKNQLINMISPPIVEDSSFFCKLSLSSSHGGSVFFYSEKRTEENIVHANITEAFWGELVSLCKQMLMAVFPEVSENEIVIKRKKALGLFECAPDDGHYHYDEKYRMDFDVKYLHPKTSRKYDSVHIDCNDSFEVSLFKNGSYVFHDTTEDTTLADYGIDESILYAKAVAMIKFVSRNNSCVISDAFRKEVYSDGSGGFYLDFLSDGPTIETNHAVDQLSIIQFGNYPYYEDARKKPIEWIVLKRDEEKILLLSRYGIDQKRYHDMRESTSWEKSDLRKWLNTCFIEQAFDVDEKHRILPSRTDSTTNLFYGTENIESCIDRVFILSVEEIKEYLPNKEMALCQSTPYSKEKGVFTNYGGLWWTRTPGEMPSLQSFVNVVGEVSYAGCYYQRNEVAVRPAIWISVS